MRPRRRQGVKACPAISAPIFPPAASTNSSLQRGARSSRRAPAREPRREPRTATRARQLLVRHRRLLPEPGLVEVREAHRTDRRRLLGDAAVRLHLHVRDPIGFRTGDRGLYLAQHGSAAAAIQRRGGILYANLTPIYVAYVSRDPSYGLNVMAWPAHFVDYVTLRLARYAAFRITGDARMRDAPQASRGSCEARRQGRGSDGRTAGTAAGAVLGACPPRRLRPGRALARRRHRRFGRHRTARRRLNEIRAAFSPPGPSPAATFSG